MPAKYQKLPPEKQIEVLKIIKNGGSYGDAKKYLKEKYDIGVSTVAIHKLVHRTKEYMTPEFLTSQMDENKKSDLAIASSLTATLEIAMEMYEDMMNRLKEKYDSGDWNRSDFLMFDKISDRLMKLRTIMFPSVNISKEISFTKKDVGKEYHVTE